MKFWSAAAACLLAASMTACSAAPTPETYTKVEVLAATATSSEAASSKPEVKKTAVVLSTKTVKLGETLVIHVENAKTATAKTTLPHQPQFYPDGDGLTAFLPVAYTTAVGKYDLTIQSGKNKFNYTISVVDREFPLQELTIDPGTAGSTNTDEANIEWAKKIEPLKLVGDAEKYWDGKFMTPVPETTPITTEYGTIRRTNGSKNVSRHSGIDFAAKRGTQAVAANGGRIQFAGKLTLTGYTVVIEHGFGLKSFYYHMDSIDTKEGAMVKKGDPIGKVGSTGYSTGPHLHYSLLVNDIFINPWTAFAQDIGAY